MSRTYRKNTRWYTKSQGQFYSWYEDKTVFGTPKNYIIEEWIKGGVVTETKDGGNFSQIVTVMDVDNSHRGAGKENKTMYHRIDRARFKQALYYNEDAFIRTSADPWDWD